MLATVKGDVHDIGKNLVDIILSNNGYNVVNIGIKQPVAAILEAAEEHQADVIGMSGLLVKSTVIMKENLRGAEPAQLADRLPGDARRRRADPRLRRAGPAEIYEGEVRYARDAFEGLRLMDAFMAVKRGVPGAALPELRKRRVTPARRGRSETEPEDMPARSDVATDNPVPDPAVLGHPRRQGHPAGRLRLLARRAARCSWASGACKPTRAGDGPALRGAGRDRGPPAAAHVAGPAAHRGHARGRRRLRLLPVRVQGRRPDRAARRRSGAERTRFTFPRQRRDRRLCLADFFRPEESGETDVVGLQVVTVGSRIREAAAELFEANAYRDYLELHGLSVQLAEALAEYWHARVRSELGFAGEDPPTSRTCSRQVPRRPLLARLRRLPRPGGPGEDRRAARARADRRPALRGVPAPPRAVHRRDRHPPPRGQVLQRLTPPPPEVVAWSRPVGEPGGPISAALLVEDGLHSPSAASQGRLWRVKPSWTRSGWLGSTGSGGRGARRNDGDPAGRGPVDGLAAIRDRDPVDGEPADRGGGGQFHDYAPDAVGERAGDRQAAWSPVW